MNTDKKDRPDRDAKATADTQREPLTEEERERQEERQNEEAKVQGGKEVTRSAASSDGSDA